MDRNTIKLIKQIKSEIKDSKFQNLIKYIEDCDDYTKLKIVKEQKILFNIVNNTKSNNVYKKYLNKVKLLNERDFNCESNYIKFIRFISNKIESLNKEKEFIILKLNEETLYTNLFRVGRYDELNKNKAIYNNKVGIYGQIIALEEAAIEHKSSKIGINIDKYIQVYSDQMNSNNRELAFLITSLLNDTINCVKTMSYAEDEHNIDFFYRYCSLCKDIEYMYNLNDEITYGKMIIESFSKKQIILRYKNIEVELNRIAAQRLENVRYEEFIAGNINEDVFNQYSLLIKEIIQSERKNIEKRNIGIFNKPVEEMYEEVRDIINGEFYYEDYLINEIEDLNIKYSYLILIILICQWIVHKNVITESDGFFKYFYPINFDAILEYVSVNFDEKNFIKDNEKLISLFINNINNKEYSNILYSPFIRLNDGHTYGITGIIERLDWPLFLRKRLLTGGHIAKQYGISLESYLEKLFILKEWKVVKREFKIKENKKDITDCDLVVYKNGLILLVQVKSSTKAKTAYSEWCNMDAILKGVEQGKLCKKFITLENFQFKQLLQENSIDKNDVVAIEPVVIIPNYSYSNLIDEISIINIRYLQALLDGGKMMRVNKKEKLIEKINDGLSINWNAMDFIKLMKYNYVSDYFMKGYSKEYLGVKFHGVNIKREIVVESDFIFN